MPHKNFKIFAIFILLGFATLGWTDQPPFIYNNHGKRDPFWKLVTPGGAIVNYETDILISDISLEGIIVGSRGSNLAIINNIVVKPKDRIGAFIIQKIDRDKVFLTDGQESFVLKLPKEE